MGGKVVRGKPGRHDPVPVEWVLSHRCHHLVTQHGGVTCVRGLVPVEGPIRFPSESPVPFVWVRLPRTGSTKRNGRRNGLETDSRS